MRGRFSTDVPSDSPCPTLDVDGRVVVPLKSKVASRTEMYCIHCIRETAFSIGGMPPVGHAVETATFVDEDLLDEEEVWASAATRTRSSGSVPRISCT